MENGDMARYGMKENRAKEARPMLSVLAFLACGSFYKILAVLGIMAFLERVCLELALEKRLGERQGDFSGIGLNGAGPEGIIDHGSMTPVFFLAAMGMIFLILCLAEREWKGVRTGYTLQRLRVTGKQLFLIMAGYNALAFLLLFVTQIGVGLWFCQAYSRRISPEYVSPQIVFLTFYRSEFLHCVLPMAETGKWVRNLFLVLALGSEAAGWEDKAAAGRIALYVITAVWFVLPVGLSVIEAMHIVICAEVCALAALRAFGVLGKRGRGREA